MARATSPNHPIAASSGELPKPRFSVGDQVKFTFRPSGNGSYYYRQLVRHELKQVRRFRTERPMLPSNKEQIRQKLRLIAEASRIEVAGIAPIYGHNLGSIANECYLPGMNCIASPLEYAYYLCFRGTDLAGDTVAYIPQLAIVTGGNLVLAAPEQ